MPRICAFYGIVFAVYFADHRPRAEREEPLASIEPLP